MFGNMTSPYMQLIQQMQGNSPTGFTQPGGGMPSGAPQLPQNPQQHGAMGAIPPMMPGQPQQGGGGMFSMLSNPAVMQALMSMKGGGAPGAGMMGPQPQTGSAIPAMGPFQSTVGGAGSPAGMADNSGLMAMIQKMFAGGQ